MNALQMLKGMLDESIPVSWSAGTFICEGMMLNPNSWEPIKGFLQREANESQPYTKEEKYLWSKLYVKHKTDKHSFWEESQEVIKDWEK